MVKDPQIDLSKLEMRKETVINIKKDLGIPTEKAQVVLALDYSGSMHDLYKDGTVQELLERALALAIPFDDDGKVPFYLFHDGYHKPQDIKLSTVGTIVSEVTRKYRMGGTDYAPVMKAIMQDLIEKETTTQSTGFFGMSKKTVSSFSKTPLETPVYVLFVTDGDTSNRSGVEAVVKEASQYGIFFQFVGIGHSSFEFLDKLDNMSGRVVDNANFFKVVNLQTTSDEDLYRKLLAEYPLWLKEARSKNIIK